MSFIDLSNVDINQLYDDVIEEGYTMSCCAVGHYTVCTNGKRGYQPIYNGVLYHSCNDAPCKNGYQNSAYSKQYDMYGGHAVKYVCGDGQIGDVYSVLCTDMQCL